MIQVTRLNGSKFYINEDHIEFMEETPDTVITFTNEKKLVVKEGIKELIESIVEFRKRIYLGDTSHLIKGE